MLSLNIYIEKEQIAGAKKDYQVMRKSPGHVTWVRALKLKTCKATYQKTAISDEPYLLLIKMRIIITTGSIAFKQ
jgi:hypothetical protein